MKPALLLLNGPIRNPAAVKKAARGAVIICADGGMRQAMRMKLKPSVVLGDMDSIPRRLPRWKGTAYLVDFDQYRSDSEKAFEFLVKSGFRRVFVAGADGGRLDHQLVNLAVMERWAKKLQIRLLGSAEAVLAGVGLHRLSTQAGDHVSLIAVGPSAVVSTTGLYFPLKKTKLVRGSRGLSNLAAARRVAIRVHHGLVWIVKA